MINLTQHPAAPGQGVTDLTGEELKALKLALTFDVRPTTEEVSERAELIAQLAFRNGLGEEDDPNETLTAMIGGAPYLMAPLERALRARGIEPMYAFSTRVSVEETQPDGSIRKVNVFRHAGFISAT